MASLSIKCVILMIAVLFDKSFQFLLDTRENSVSRCPTTVTHDAFLRTFRDKCYEFVIYQQKYWSDARNDCKSKGGDLIVIPDAETQNFVIMTLQDLRNSHDGIWLGLSDRKHELHWEWVNGEPLTGYNNWGYKQGGANILHLTQDCAQIRLNDHGLWHDRECHLWPNTFPYICEFDMLPWPSTTQSVKTVLPTTEKFTTPLKTTLMSSTSFKHFPSMTSTMTSLETSTKGMSTFPAETKASIANSTIASNEERSIMTSDSSNLLTTDSKLPSSKLFTVLSTKPTTTESVVTTNGDSGFELTSGFVNKAASTLKPPHVSQFESTRSSTTMNNPSVSNNMLSQSNTDLSTGSLHSSSYSFLSTKLPLTTKRTTTKVVCSTVDCGKNCPHGYSGIYVGADGCVECICS
ncbi:C-type lectin (CTL) or carbohydrate-recognition domain (CRD) [Mactra antiquata]